MNRQAVKLLYKDGDIAVCIKPKGILSQSGEGANMIDLLSGSLGCDVFPVHRLDKETEGIMVFAMNAPACAALSKQIADGTFRKNYLALLTACPDDEKGTLEDLIFYDRNRSKSFVVKKERKGVKKAKLSYEIVSNAGGLPIAFITLFTGRTHQIRVQFASRSCPLYGDKRYGGKGDEMHLYACRLAFKHPVTNEEMVFDRKEEYLNLLMNFAKQYEKRKRKIKKRKNIKDS
ncbi:MAG: RluA family pseudouridine synthase [Clostridiales bacterium]|nr:RluA family pseudouridine synthase [Clostridiales bacterium]